MSPAFQRYIGIDYSGAGTATSSLPGLRVYEADGLSIAHEIAPPPSPRKYWTRKGIAEWLVTSLSTAPEALVGIDHGFSFPLKYFERYHLPLDWNAFLEDFRRHWPTDEDHTYVDFVRGAAVETLRHARGIPTGEGSLKCAEGPNRYSISRFRARLPNPVMPVFPDCVMSGSGSAIEFIFGHSTDGMCRPTLQ